MMNEVPLDQDFPTFDELEIFAKDLFREAYGNFSPIFVSTMLDQYRSLLRNHMVASECDPYDAKQLKTFVIGVLIAMHMQQQYTPIAPELITLPMTALNMMYFPTQQNVAEGLENLALLFSTEQKSVKRSRLHQFFNFRRKSQ
jgi:hypothetical protein